MKSSSHHGVVVEANTSCSRETKIVKKVMITQSILKMRLACKLMARLAITRSP